MVTLLTTHTLHYIVTANTLLLQTRINCSDFLKSVSPLDISECSQVY